MGELDITEKLFADYEDVFADIMNGFLFKGNPIIKPEDLARNGVISQYKAEDSKIHEEERDVCKNWTKKGIRLAIYGLENQTNVCNEMAARVIGYDGASYRSQLLAKEKEQQIVPVVTLVLYFGEKSWSGPRCLSDLVNVPEELNPYFNDYRLNIAEVALLEEEQLSWFHSDFYMVAEYFVKKRIYGKSYQPSSQHIKHVDEFLKLMAVLTKDSNWTSLPEEIKERKGGVSMCDVLEYREEKGIEKGIEKGKDQLSLKAEELKKAGKSAEEILSTLFPKLNYSKE